MTARWIQTLERKKLDQRYLTVEAVGSIEEIAHSLAGEFRFNRMTRQRYSVAEHAVRGSHLLAPVFAGAFLLHELSETYAPDIPAPLKPFLSITMDDGSVIPWVELERRHTHTILEALGLLSIETLIYSPEVRHMDLAMLAAEKRDLHDPYGPEPESWGLVVPPSASTVNPWSCDAAEAAFLERFHTLFTKRP